MKTILCLIAGLLLSHAASSQMVGKMATVYFNDGCYSVARKNYFRAISEFSQAIGLDPGFKEAYENRGVAKYYSGNYIDAIVDFSKALEIDSNDYNTYGRRGWAKLHLQDCRGAISDFTKAVKGCENAAQYYNLMGEAKYYLTDYNGAIEDFNKVLKFGGGGKVERSKAFFWRGFIEIDLGQKQSGCLDLARSGKLGYQKADEIEEIYCR